MAKADSQPVHTMTKKEKIRYYLKEALITGILVLVVLAIRSSFASTYRVPTGSMIPTILPGDHFFASQMTYGIRVPFSDFFITANKPPERGQIIVFPSPIEPDINLVKRVVAIGGDKLEVREGRLIINGKEIEVVPVPTAEAPLGGTDVFYEKLDNHQHFVQFDDRAPSLRNLGPIDVPEAHFFAMGDNRDHSADSRYFGPVPYEKLRARALRLFISLDSSFPYLRLSRFFGPMP